MSMCSPTGLSVPGLSRASILVTLFNHTPVTYASLSWKMGGLVPLTLDEAEDIVVYLDDYVGIVRGRCINVSGLNKGLLNFTAFELRHGPRITRELIIALKKDMLH